MHRSMFEVELLQILVPFINRFVMQMTLFSIQQNELWEHIQQYISKNILKKPFTLRQKGSSNFYFKLPEISVKVPQAHVHLHLDILNFFHQLPLLCRMIFQRQIICLEVLFATFQFRYTTVKNTLSQCQQAKVYSAFLKTVDGRL